MRRLGPSLTLCAITWGVGFAETAVGQIFECIDLKYRGAVSDSRSAEVQREIVFVRQIVSTAVTALGSATSHLEPGVIAAIKQ